jgi:hypothetical protein
VPPKKNNGDPLTDSERAALDEWRDEREFQERLAKLRRERIESLSSIGKGIGAIVVALTFARDALVWVWSALKTWAGLP